MQMLFQTNADGGGLLPGRRIPVDLTIKRRMLGFILPLVFILWARAAGALPEDFPRITVTVYSNPAPGYIFLSNFTQDSSVTTTPYLIILDNQGQPFRYRKLQSPINTDFKRQPGGEMTYFHLMGTNMVSTNNFSFHFVDRTLQTTGSITAVTTGAVTALNPEWMTDVHELRMRPNRHGYLLAYRFMTTDMLPFGGKRKALAMDMAIQEVDADGNLYWHWAPRDFFTPRNATPDVPLTNRIVDYAHCNSIDVDHDDHILLSTRYFDEVTKINRQTGDIIWRMGGTCCSNNQFAFINDEQPQEGGGTFIGFSHQHGVRRLGNGNILLFDNGNLKNPPYSRAVEYEVDEENMTATKVWEFMHDPPIVSTEMGFAQRLGNGNTLICWGGGPGQIAVTEVTPQSNIVFEMTLPEGVHTYRAYKEDLFLVSARWERPGGDLLLTWASRVGQTNQVQSISQFSPDAVWQDIGTPISGTGSSITARVSASVTSCFYRIKAQ